MNSAAATKVPASTTAAKTSTPLEIFSLSDRVRAALRSLGDLDIGLLTSMRRMENGSNCRRSAFTIFFIVSLQHVLRFGWVAPISDVPDNDELITQCHLISAIHII